METPLKNGRGLSWIEREGGRWGRDVRPGCGFARATETRSCKSKTTLQKNAADSAFPLVQRRDGEITSGSTRQKLSEKVCRDHFSPLEKEAWRKGWKKDHYSFPKCWKKNTAPHRSTCSFNYFRSRFEGNYWEQTLIGRGDISLDDLSCWVKVGETDANDLKGKYGNTLKGR